MIPFDFKMQARILKLHWQHKGLSVTTLLYLTGILPLIVLSHLIHQFFFVLDGLFFPSYRAIPTDGATFIIGPPRCGTSLFQDLLNESDEITSMKLWELQFAPSICEKLFYLQLGKMDRRLGSPLYKLYQKINQKLFAEFAKIHKTSLFHYEEDAMLFYHSGNSPFFVFFFPFYELKNPFLNFDHFTSAEYKAKYMDYYRQCIQKHLFVFGRHKTFLSKNPFFSTYILTLKAHFQDARFIYMTRTPYSVAPSAFRLSTFYKGYQRYVDDEFIKKALLELLQVQYTYPLETLNFADAKHHAIIRYDDLVADTQGTVMQLLEQFQLTCTDRLKEALARRDKQAKRYVSKNQYSLDTCNISETEFKTYFAEILARFGYGQEWT